MSGREPPLPADPDDWFGGTVAVHDQRGVDNDWLDNQPRSPRPQREIYGVDLRLWLAGAGILAVLVVAGLAVGGVFSGGTRHPASTPPVSQPQRSPVGRDCGCAVARTAPIVARTRACNAGDAA